MGAWVGIDRGLDTLLAEINRSEDRELREQERVEAKRDRLTQTLLPSIQKALMESSQARKAKAALIQRGTSLFGERVATALANWGRLEETLSEFKGAKDEEVFTQRVVARVGGYLDTLAASDKEEDAEKLAALTKSIPANQGLSDAETSDYINNILADGVVTYGEYFDALEIASPTASPVVGGVTPNLGEPDVFSQSQVYDLSREAVAGMTPDVEVTRSSDGKLVTTFTGNMSAEEFDDKVMTFARIFDDAQIQNPGVKALDLARKRFAEMASTPPGNNVGEEAVETTTVTAPDPVDVMNVDSMTTTESIGDMEVKPSLMPKPEGDTNTWAGDAERKLEERFAQ